MKMPLHVSPPSLMYRVRQRGALDVQTVSIASTLSASDVSATTSDTGPGTAFRVVKLKSFIVDRGRHGQIIDITPDGETDGSTPLGVEAGEIVEIWIQFTSPRLVGNFTGRLQVTGTSSSPGQDWAFSVLISVLVPRWEFVGLKIYSHQDNNRQFLIGGRVSAVAFDPVRKDRCYIGAASGGVWRTIDRGQTWVLLSDAWPAQSVSSVAVDPTFGDTIFTGTGDMPGGSADGIGVIRTVNGGGG